AHLHGFVTFSVEFSALFCIPKKDKIIQCKIKTLNNFGALATAYPMDIIIPKQLQVYESKGLSIFSKIKEGDYIYVKVIDYNLQNQKLIVIGLITDLVIDK